MAAGDVGGVAEGGAQAAQAAWDAAAAGVSELWEERGDSKKRSTLILHSASVFGYDDLGTNRERVRVPHRTQSPLNCPAMSLHFEV